jgi:hypothetical protein
LAEVQHRHWLTAIDKFSGRAHWRAGDLAEFHHREHLDHPRGFDRMTIRANLKDEEEHELGRYVAGNALRLATT